VYRVILMIDQGKVAHNETHYLVISTSLIL